MTSYRFTAPTGNVRKPRRPCENHPRPHNAATTESTVANLVACPPARHDRQSSIPSTALLLFVCPQRDSTSFHSSTFNLLSISFVSVALIPYLHECTLSAGTAHHAAWPPSQIRARSPPVASVFQESRLLYAPAFLSASLCL